MAVLLGLAVLLSWLCVVGLVVLPDIYQKLHFAAPVVGVAAVLIAAAVWVGESDWQARSKVVLTVFILFFTNSILAHATARAHRIRQKGRWEVEPGEGIRRMSKSESGAA